MQHTFTHLGIEIQSEARSADTLVSDGISSRVLLGDAVSALTTVDSDTQILFETYKQINVQ